MADGDIIDSDTAGAEFPAQDSQGPEVRAAKPAIQKIQIPASRGNEKMRCLNLHGR